LHLMRSSIVNMHRFGQRLASQNSCLALCEAHTSS
jgi:hypothetical protein